MALLNQATLLDEFLVGLELHGITAPAIAHRLLAAGEQHANRQPRNLPAGRHIVYAFSLSAAYGATCPAGPNRVLRVGKATVDGRMSQNYNQYDTGKGLPDKLETLRVFWPHLGLVEAAPRLNGVWSNWIEQHTDRDQFEFPHGNEPALNLLEKFIRGRVGVLFEG